MARKTVLVIDDDPAICEIIAINLRAAGLIPLSAHDSLAANRLICEASPDLILLDWMLPGQPVLSFARELRNNHHTKNTGIIMLAASSEEADVIAGLEAGADDYVTKPFSPRELVARIRTLLRRRAPEWTNDVTVIGPLTLNLASRRVFVASEDTEEILDFGPTEFTLLHYLMNHPERVHSRAQLLDSVWGDQRYVDDRTVDVYIKHLRARLSKVNLSDLIQTVRGVGYRLTTETFHERRTPRQPITSDLPV
ncbi:winged helix-turn-helix domain-containing protein [Cupriavidus basilensis]|uniref:Phosphate regulon transcriptional regulatory protein PhoB (SphR) n=1 Tax=Cupriavidus basilensis TaxID=68895 RepID=A0A0C4YRY8_9BURK|nr:winged helix-turn-helix domain-containing protein [Cupriavidus basilensis]AJG24674.1 Phosphate regulon transcriptional regulatory protein PhoB (SphR) [Cupriavidus basilensis]